jgi:hypothetical protein
VNNDDDPTRLRQLATPGSRLERGLTSARGRGPSEAELHALGAAVFGASAGGIAAPKAAASAFRLAGLTKATMVLAVAGVAAGTAGVAWRHRHPHPSADHVPSTPAPARSTEPGLGLDVTPLAAAPLAAPPSERPSSVHIERRHAAAAPVPSRPQPNVSVVEMPPGTAPPAQRPTDADEELRLVGAAQRALSRDPTRALALVREHARRFPDGALAEERDALFVSALWETGRKDEARTLARRFTQEHPGSTYVARMREILRQADSNVP